MRAFPRFIIGTIIMASALFPPRGQSDEAMLPDGKRLQGALELDGKGRLRFAVTGQSSSLSLSDVQHVRFSSPPASPRPPATVHRVLLPGGQQLTGELLELNDKELTLRTTWKDRFTIPRRAVVAVTHPPGWVTVFDEDFENDLKRWNLTGAPSLSDRRQSSGKRSLLLDKPGQVAEYSLTPPPEAGRVRISFYDPGKGPGVRRLFEVEFTRGDKSGIVRATLMADTEDYKAVVAPSTTKEAGRIPRSADWHSLDLRFSRDYLLMGVDDQVLWASDKVGPGGPLRSLRLIAIANNGDRPVPSEVFFDDLNLSRAVDHLPHQIEDPGQDEAWLLAGDQLLGNVIQADRRSIDFRMSTGRQTLGWGDVRGLFLKRETLPPQTTDGEHVRLGLHSPAASDPDSLEGVVQALDARRLVLRHPVLGNLEIERGRLQRLQGLFHGRRVELDNAFHHLGDPNRPSVQLQPARAEGTSLRRTFRLEEVPGEVRLVVQVTHLKGPGDGFGKELDRGERRTEVVVNGQRIDYLNRHVGRASPEPQRVTVVLPRRCLQAGENVLEIRQTPEKGSERYESCGINGIVLEIAGK